MTFLLKPSKIQEKTIKAHIVRHDDGERFTISFPAQVNSWKWPKDHRFVKLHLGTYKEDLFIHPSHYAEYYPIRIKDAVVIFDIELHPEFPNLEDDKYYRMYLNKKGAPSIRLID